MPYLHNIIFILPKTIEDSKEVLHTVFMGNEGVFAIILKEDNSLVGSIGIITDPKRENTRTRMLGYWLKECHWGKGMASEATRTILDYGFRITPVPDFYWNGTDLYTKVYSMKQK